MEPFPNSHTTTTTVHTTTTTTTVVPIAFDKQYFKTKQGILKCIELVLNLLGFICVSTSLYKYQTRGAWFNTVAMGGFWFTGIMLVLYLFNVVNRLRLIPWLHIQLVFCALWSVFYLIAASLLADQGFIEAFAAAAFFGYCAMVCYGFDAFLSYESIRGATVIQ